MSKKFFATTGMIFCVLFIILGFVTLFRDNSCSTASRSGLYDSGLASFGADFYTYVSNNAAEAASAACTAANNIYDLYDLLTNVFGWLFLFAGFTGLCHFGIVRADCPKASGIPLSQETPSSIDEPYTGPGTEDNVQ